MQEDNVVTSCSNPNANTTAVSGTSSITLSREPLTTPHWNCQENEEAQTYPHANENENADMFDPLRSSHKGGLLNFMDTLSSDPPLVSATRILPVVDHSNGSPHHQPLPHDQFLLVQATAVESHYHGHQEGNDSIVAHAEQIDPLTLAWNRTNNPTTETSVQSTQQQSSHHNSLFPFQRSQPFLYSHSQQSHASSQNPSSSAQLDPLHVQIDEETPASDPLREIQESSSTTMTTDASTDRFKHYSNKSSFCHRHDKLILLVACAIFLIIGVVTAIAIVVYQNQTSRNNQKSIISLESLTPSTLPTSAPTITFTPTISPSCSAEWILSHLDTSLADRSYENFLMSSDGTTAVLTFSEQRFLRQDAFFFTTLDFTELGILISDMRQTNLDISEAAISMDGSRLVLGVTKDIYDSQELGGALWVYQQVERHVWIPRQYHFTGGGSQGTVFSVAINTNGTIQAIVAGSYDNIIPPHVQVYRSTEDLDMEDLVPMGDRIVDGAFNNLTLVGLAGNGLRLFVYSDDGVLRILNYVNETWQQREPILTIKASDSQRTLTVAESGNSFALLSRDVGSASYVFRWNRSAWVTHVIPAPEQPNITLQQVAFSSQGHTLVMATGNDAVGFRTLHVYEQEFDAWTIADTIDLSQGFSRLLGLAVVAEGDRVVVAGDQNLRVYERTCSSILQSQGPTWTLSPVTPVAPSPVPPTAPTMGILNSPVAGDFAPSVNGESSLKPQEPGLSACTFERIILHNLTQDTAFESSATSWTAPRSDNSTSILSFAKGKWISGDGSIMVVTTSNEDSVTIETYDLKNVSAPPSQLSIPYPMMSIAVSGSGDILACGTADFSGLLNNGAQVFVYRRKGLDWVREIDYNVATVASGGVVDVSITDDGKSLAYAVAGENETSSISVFRIDRDVLQEVGRPFAYDWIDFYTTVRLVDERLFIAGSDGFVRTFDLFNNTWKRVGQLVPHFFEAMFIPSNNNTVIAISSRFFGVVVYDLVDSYWIPTLPSELSPLSPSSQLSEIVDFSVSSDGNEILLTEATIGFNDSIQQNYVLKWFQRINNSYGIKQVIDLSLNGTNAPIEIAQLTTSRDVIVATDQQIVQYRQNETCLPAVSLDASANGS